MELKVFKPISLTVLIRDCKGLSSIHFADDTLFSREDKDDQLNNIRVVLLAFEVACKLHVDFEKGSFSSMRNITNIQQLAWIPGFKIGTSPTSGIPLGAKHKSKVYGVEW